ncbi:MAG: GxGYxYP family putative glycoside hydrolase [candidate division KSB1 bacterium]|nr:GxGYxYP family putative glycoside hydrolase [candidate division KSB1 bacterium]MDZ7319800.1 GxGYxYP family putative glycoside hydrolase [candidate division KSB1 bacterium]MDZ7342266.1 GxGYxYP family putative glycoside hydrolase [candidate division KSB1 bacterium]
MSIRATLLIGFYLISASLCSAGHQDFNGSWELVPQKSAAIPLYRTLLISFQVSDSQVTVIQKWGTRLRDAFSDTVRLITDGRKVLLPLQHQVAPTSVFLGVRNLPGVQREMSGTWNADGTVLTIHERLPIGNSQGQSEIRATHTYTLSLPAQIITYNVTRASRKKDDGLSYTLKRAGSRQAYFMRLEDDWAIDGKLPQQALLISMQGLANSNGPNLYFIYPEKWDFRYTPGLFDFLQNERYFSFKELRTPEQVLATFRDHVTGYVVWDKAVRTSLIVAFTVAGLEQAAVVSEELIPLVEKFGLKPVADFRGQFTGQSDYQIYRWAKEQYWDRCNKEYIVWLGGEHGNIMKPGVADWGIHNKMFFNDLCANQSIPEEYQLTNELLSEMKPYGFAFGWHSYKKDLEEEWVRLTSSYALRVEGLHSLPNMSFSSQVSATPGFVFKNNHNLVPAKTYRPKRKVYITCIQTDGIGLGAWNQPGRGEIPYAWEVSMNYSWLAPVMLEYFYSQATPNDYFIGCLGGPGYVYPKAVPKQHLPKMVELAYDLMKRLDLNVFEIMDYSEGVMVEGNSDLTRDVVDAFYRGMPDAIGFVNGYVQSHTFTVRDKRPLISYDYYLAPEATEEQVAADLEELAQLNRNRPYFLLMHVRQYSNVKRVKSILSRLGSEFEVVPLDIFLKLAGEQPTFRERFRE